MPAERYFLDIASFQKGEEHLLEGQEYHHLVRVMRTRLGEVIELINGRRELARADVVYIDRGQVKVRLLSVVKSKPLSPFYLLQALPRFDRLETIIEKGTELNVTEFWLFPADYSEKLYIKDHQKKRLRHITIAAMKQSGRLDLPSISWKSHFRTWPLIEGNVYFGDTREIAPFWGKIHFTGYAYFFIGPEKGWSESELIFLETKLAARGVRLHPNILRVDTAAIAACLHKPNEYITNG